MDTTFVQFYPTLLPVAKAKGTLSKEYLKDEAGEVRANVIVEMSGLDAGPISEATARHYNCNGKSNSKNKYEGSSLRSE